MALIVWQRPNLLLLDEPTNHLDLDMRQALTEALIDGSGGDRAIRPPAPLQSRSALRLKPDAYRGRDGWQRPNLLLLDEPTNHLDLDMRQALTEALIDFEGLIIFQIAVERFDFAIVDKVQIVGGGADQVAIVRCAGPDRLAAP
jgi:ABC-type protease/lipase transport system fused ATPase/permease subunit